MILKLYQSAFLLFICIIVLFATKISLQSPTSIIAEIIANCKFEPGSDYRDGSYPTSIDWCPNQRKPMTALINHMKLNSQGMDASFGSEFGANVKIIYLPPVILINPQIKFRSEELFECHDAFGSEVVVAIRPKFIKVEYINENFEITTQSFKEADACLLLSITQLWS